MDLLGFPGEDALEQGAEAQPGDAAEDGAGKGGPDAAPDDAAAHGQGARWQEALRGERSVLAVPGAAVRGFKLSMMGMSSAPLSTIAFVGGLTMQGQVEGYHSKL